MLNIQTDLRLTRGLRLLEVAPIIAPIQTDLRLTRGLREFMYAGSAHQTHTEHNRDFEKTLHLSPPFLPFKSPKV